MAMGMVWTVLLNGMLALGGYTTARYGFRQPRGLARGLAAATIAWAWLTLGMEWLGPLGWLTLGPLSLWIAALLAIGLVLRLRGAASIEVAAVDPRSNGWTLEATFALGLLIWEATIMGVQSLLFAVKAVSDGPIYHLYFAARWWKEGRLFLVATPFGENAATYFPAVGDLWFTWLMMTWGGDRLARIGQLPFFLVSALAAFGLARRLGAGFSASVIATAWFVTVTPFFLFTFEPNVDTIFVAGYLIAGYFFVDYALADRRAEALALGGLAAGGALGTKATGIVFVPVLLALAAVAVIRSTAPMTIKVRNLLLLVVCPSIMAVFWFARNVWLTGNPLYPLQVTVGGLVVLGGWYDSSVMDSSKYYIGLTDWREFSEAMLAVLDPRQALLWVAALLGAWVWGSKRIPNARWIWGACALAWLNVALYWGLIPYRTQTRFMFQALGVAVVPLAHLLSRSRWLTTLGVVLLAAHLTTPEGWPLSPKVWDFSRAVPNDIPGLISLPRSIEEVRRVSANHVSRTAMLGLLTLGAGAMVVAWAWVRVASRAHSRRWLGASLATAGLLALTIALVVQGPLNPRQTFYPIFPNYESGWLNLELRASPSGSRVAYAGTNLPYYLLGVGLRNDVRYINVDRHRDWLLHDYHRQAQLGGKPNWPNTRPGWDRIHPDYHAWLANLRAERIQILVVARADPLEGPHNVADSESFPIERQWAETHRETFEPLYGVAERDPWFRVYRVRPQATGQVRRPS
jgi:hypothetical protein